MKRAKILQAKMKQRLKEASTKQKNRLQIKAFKLVCLVLLLSNYVLTLILLASIILGVGSMILLRVLNLNKKKCQKRKLKVAKIDNEISKND